MTVRSDDLSQFGDLARAIDPVQFARSLGMEPDPWQAEVLRSRESKICLRIGRQCGKSSAAGLIAAHTTLYRPKSLTLLISPSQRQSGEVFRKCLGFYRDAGRPLDSEAESALQLQLENGSRIVSLPGKDGTVRGYSGVDLLIIDEAAYVNENVYDAVSPMLSVSQGNLLVMSTPAGKRGFFYDIWEHEDGWLKLHVPARLCPRHSVQWLEQQRRARGEAMYMQEYEAEFIDIAGTTFAAEDIDAAIDPAFVPLALWPLAS